MRQSIVKDLNLECIKPDEKKTRKQEKRKKINCRHRKTQQLLHINNRNDETQIKMISLLFLLHNYSRNKLTEYKNQIKLISKLPLPNPRRVL